MNKKRFFRKTRIVFLFFSITQKQNLISAVIFQSDYKLLKPKQKNSDLLFQSKAKTKKLHIRRTLFVQSFFPFVFH
jgi:hypothetical protein